MSVEILSQQNIYNKMENWNLRINNRKIGEKKQSIIYVVCFGIQVLESFLDSVYSVLFGFMLKYSLTINYLIISTELSFSKKIRS